MGLANGHLTKSGQSLRFEGYPYNTDPTLASLLSLMPFDTSAPGLGCAKTETCCGAVAWRSQASDVRSFSRESYNMHRLQHRSGWWHPSGAALIIWLTRNWTVDELTPRAFR